MEDLCLECSHPAPFICTFDQGMQHTPARSRPKPSPKPGSPRSPLSKASARGGLRSLSRDSSWGLASSISRSRAGLSRPWGNEGASGGEGRGRCAGGGGCCEDVPGTAMLLKSILGRPERKGTVSVLDGGSSAGNSTGRKGCPQCCRRADSLSSSS